MDLDPNSPIPLHIQLKELLKSKIKERVFTEKIPSERELMDQYNVSRTTVREAVSALVHEGILEKIHGKGTFIKPQRSVNNWLGNLSSFNETIERLGMKPGAKLLTQEIRRDAKVSQMLGIEESYYIKRIRFADGDPIAIERHHYPVELGKKLADYDLDEVGIYATLESLGVQLDCAKQKITAQLPTSADAKILGITPTTSVLVIERLTFDPTGKRIEYYSAVYRGDKYSLITKVYRTNPTYRSDYVDTLLANFCI